MCGYEEGRVSNKRDGWPMAIEEGEDNFREMGGYRGIGG
jgi:hypothetical protein